jgi:hypothetical protein
MSTTETPEKAMQPSLNGMQIAIVSVLYSLLTPHGMALNGVPDDSVIYTYVGWGMKHGALPYVDLWDHKGPLLYEIERAGAIMSHPGWGMIALDFVAAACSIAMLLWVACRLLGPRASIALTVAAGLFGTLTSCGGNLTETWAVLFLAGAQVCAFLAARRRLHPSLPFLTGAALAAVFWLRPNMCVFAGLAAVYILWEFFRQRGLKASLVQLASGVLGFVVVTALSLARVVTHGALPAMKAAYFGYNVAYSRFVTTTERIHAVTSFARQLYPDALSMLAVASWIILAVTLLRQKKTESDLPRSYRALLLVSAIIEAVGISLSGRAYLHYLYILLPTMFVMCALALHWCGAFLPANDSSAGRVVLPYRRLVWLLLIIIAAPRRIPYMDEMRGQRVNRPAQAMTNLVERVTLPTDRIALVGGPEAGYVYLHAQRFATSKYFYTLPIVHDALPQVEAVRSQYVQDLIAYRPKVIASDPYAETGFLCGTVEECTKINRGKDAEGYDRGVLPRMLQPFLAADYVRYAPPELGDWHVYLRKDVAEACCSKAIPE